MKRASLVLLPILAVGSCLLHETWQFIDAVNRVDVLYQIDSPDGELTATHFVYLGWAGDPPSGVVNVQRSGEPFDDWGGKRVFQTRYQFITDVRWLDDNSLQITWGGSQFDSDDLIRSESRVHIGRDVQCIIEYRDAFDELSSDKFDTYPKHYVGEVTVRESGTARGQVTEVFVWHESGRTIRRQIPLVFSADGSHVIEVTPLNDQRLRIVCETCGPSNVLTQDTGIGEFAVEYAFGTRSNG